MTIVKMACINPAKNEQKFWHGEILLNGDLKVSWGRVGAKASVKIHSLGNVAVAERKLNTLITQKRQKGYIYSVRESEAEPLAFSNLSIGPSILEMIESLESWLAPWQDCIDIKFDRQTGQLVSPLGNIDRQRLQEARTALEEADQYRRSYSGWFANKAEDYLRLIPLTGKGRLNAQSLLGDDQKIQAQREYLNLLESCLALTWDMRKLIIAELENPAISVADKAQWVEWGSGDEPDMTPAVTVNDERMAAIDW